MNNPFPRFANLPKVTSFADKTLIIDEFFESCGPRQFHLTTAPPNFGKTTAATSLIFRLKSKFPYYRKNARRDYGWRRKNQHCRWKKSNKANDKWNTRVHYTKARILFARIYPLIHHLRPTTAINTTKHRHYTKYTFRRIRRIQFLTTVDIKTNSGNILRVDFLI